MDFELNEEQKLMKDMVRNFAEKEIRPKVADYYREERYHSAGIKILLPTKG